MKKNRADKTIIVWRKLVPETQADAWVERVAWAGPERVVLVVLPGRKSCRVEVYCDRNSEAESLLKLYGGEVREVRRNAWWLTQERTFFMRAGKKFCLASSIETIPPRDRKLPYIIVPAGMAFGTGEHATTAMCLRQLAAHIPPGKWKMLDAGTGSGVLALAGSLLGGNVFAFDFDPESIREAHKNVALNSHIPEVRWKCASIEKESLKGSYDVAVANLYAGLLQKALPKLSGCLKKEGVLILSGILKSQESEILVGLRKARLLLEKRLRKGKWICLVLRRELD